MEEEKAAAAAAEHALQGPPKTSVRFQVRRKSQRCQRRRQAQQHRKALGWSTRCTVRLMNQADTYVCPFGKKLKRQYGFLPEP